MQKKGDRMNDKIVHVKVHEAVNFEKGLCTYFSTKRAPGKSYAEMELLPDIMCVKITGKSDTVLIPLVNVAYMQLECKKSIKKAEEAEKEAAKKKTNIKSQDIKRPTKLSNA